MVVKSGEMIVIRPALRIEPIGHGDGLQQRRFPAPVLPDKERDRRVEPQPLRLPDGRNPLQIGSLGNFLPFQSDVVDIHVSVVLMHGKGRGCLCQNVAVAAGELPVTSRKHGRHPQKRRRMKVTSWNQGRYRHFGLLNGHTDSGREGNCADCIAMR